MNRAKPLAAFLFVIGCGILFMQLFLAPERNPGLVMVGVAALGWMFVDLPAKPTPPVVVDPCTGGDMCGCETCAVKALFPADREWLARHGWVPASPVSAPARPKRSTWQTELDRSLAHRGTQIAARVETATSRQHAVRIETGASRRRVKAKWL